MNALRAFLIGDFDVFIMALLAAIVLSYLTGIISALINNKFSATKGMIVVLKKLLLLLIVISGTILDNVFGLNGVLRKAVIIICVLNEFGGMISNMAECGVDVPGILKNFIATAKTSAESTDVNTGGSPPTT